MKTLLVIGYTRTPSPGSLPPNPFHSFFREASLENCSDVIAMALDDCYLEIKLRSTKRAHQIAFALNKYCKFETLVFETYVYFKKT